ncbi:MAG: hypothetical protein EB140_15510, partial [Proteobacteria bacterium]|nr:hypothetical protein [Pseudomonadota bacterium]
MYIGMVVPARYAPGFTVDETLITVGATWSTVTGKISEAFPVLPAASVALAVIAWFPVASVVAIVNVPVLALVPTGSLSAAGAVAVDTTVPTVTSVTTTAADGPYMAGSVIPIVVTFSEPVTVTGTAQLLLETGLVDRQVMLTSGSGTATLTFRYTVQFGDTSADLDYVSVRALTVTGGAISDVTGNEADY